MRFLPLREVGDRNVLGRDSGDGSVFEGGSGVIDDLGAFLEGLVI